MPTSWMFYLSIHFCLFLDLLVVHESSTMCCSSQFEATRNTMSNCCSLQEWLKVLSCFFLLLCSPSPVRVLSYPTSLGVESSGISTHILAQAAPFLFQPPLSFVCSSCYPEKPSQTTFIVCSPHFSISSMLQALEDPMSRSGVTEKVLFFC